ncbi:Glycerol kinase [Hoeflea phototrophica DFL-43]|jgi:glycerol kinase|uniref:ATP:glycerol 3-phosphotransferase n=1 Tax=Hoeflea phototrophica (strain DSM 17068 / NCIMB 14078 / DFL-43) TaxID=411684 RepID=A9CVD5_HOEPD|nr:FGGY-family carbohydrate kinase [Hoeflea phototrophica]EDQ35360.1 Glycerol kinase [Hoeflea phototrophica DFL-43]
MFVLAIDQGTTNTKALVFAQDGEVVRSASASCHTDYPHPGWAEQSASEIWATTRQVIGDACAGIETEIAAIGISNQRETLVVWDATTGEPVGPAPIWQCRRTADECAALIEAGHSDEVSTLTGLGINPLFPASKLAWVLKNRPEPEDLHRVGRLRAGTVDSWLLWNLTGRAVFATDHSNASRTLLFDTERLAWSPRLGEIFGAPIDCLATPMASDARFGETAQGATTLPAGVPIHAMMGDSHAALFGHGVRGPGKVKATYGTGSSLMTLTRQRTLSSHGLSGTIAWTQDGNTAHALEGNITVSAQAAAFMAEMLGLNGPAELSDLALQVSDNGGVCFVPALAGLGAPHWQDDARGLVSGLSLGSRPAHLARATFEAIAHQVTDVLEAMEQDLGHPLNGLSADGGASANSFLMQLQADFIGKPVERREIAEIGAFGVASMAAEALGMPIVAGAKEIRIFDPATDATARRGARNEWKIAIARACR